MDAPLYRLLLDVGEAAAVSPDAAEEITRLRRIHGVTGRAEFRGEDPAAYVSPGLVAELARASQLSLSIGSDVAELDRRHQGLARAATVKWILAAAAIIVAIVLIGQVI